MENPRNRSLGLEQELFLVDHDGILSEKADDFLEICHGLADGEGVDRDCFAPECVLSTVEVCTTPTGSLWELESGYLRNLGIAIRAARETGLRLYPLATYPLPITPTLRTETHYLAQALTMGPERFRHAGRCAGVHLHLEMPGGVLDPESGVSRTAPEAAIRGMLDAYNLATALDPAIVALTRSCPFYEGQADGIAARTAHYRGSPDFAPYGLYAALPVAGGLRPYALSADELSDLQTDRHRTWLSAVEGAGLDSRLFEAAGPLKTAWNPVRLNAQDGLRGTLELRGIDSSYPSEVIAIASLVEACERRVREEGLTVTPSEGLWTLEVSGGELRVPAFELLSGTLLRESATRGLQSPEVVAYLDSVLEFAGRPPGSETLRDTSGYRNVEREILAGMPAPATDQQAHKRHLTRNEGLELVRKACDKLESQVESSQPRQREAAEAQPL